MTNNLENRIKSVVSSVFNISTDKIQNDSSPDTIESWDSLKHMNLVVALEEEFEIEFSDGDIFEMMNYKLISEIVQTKK
jgi:acyl carrier protein